MLACPADEIIIGGQRGGGKTYGVLGAFAIYADKYGADAIGVLFRRTYPELADVIVKAKKIFYPLGWTYNESTHDWKSPRGAILRLRYLDRDSDAEGYQGHEYPWQAFEEIGNFPSPTPIDLLYGCLRSASGIPKRRYLTCNPGGPGHAWVKKRYIDGRKANEIFTYHPQPVLAPALTISACFIPAALEDNPALLKNDPGYEAALAASTMGNEALYRAWRFGDWDVIAGAYFDIFTDAACCYDTDLEIKPWFARWISVDWGFKHDAAVYWFVADGAGRIWTEREVVVARHEPAALGRLIADMTPEAERSALDAVYLSPEVFDKDDSIKTIATKIGEELHKRGLPYPSRADNARVSGWMVMYQLLKTGQWKINRNCRRLIECLPLLQRDPKHPEDILKVDGDDPGDAARYGLKTRDIPVTVPTPVLIARRIDAEIDKHGSLTDRAIHAKRIVAEEEAGEHAVYSARRMTARRRR
jgi:hypothetical protein